MNEDDKVRIGYQTALGMITYEGQIIWRAFSALLAANTGLTIIAGALIKIFPNLICYGRILSILGIVICLIWILTIRRQFSYYKYWFSWMRHYENNYLSPQVMITTVGKTYGEGGTLEQNDNIPNLERFPFLVRNARIEYLIYLVVTIYILVYALIIYASYTLPLVIPT